MLPSSSAAADIYPQKASIADAIAPTGARAPISLCSSRINLPSSPYHLSNRPPNRGPGFRPIFAKADTSPPEASIAARPQKGSVLPSSLCCNRHLSSRSQLHCNNHLRTGPCFHHLSPAADTSPLETSSTAANASTRANTSISSLSQHLPLLNKLVWLHRPPLKGLTLPSALRCNCPAGVLVPIWGSDTADITPNRDPHLCLAQPQQSLPCIPNTATPPNTGARIFTHHCPSTKSSKSQHTYYRSLVHSNRSPHHCSPPRQQALLQRETKPLSSAAEADTPLTGASIFHPLLQ